MSSLMQIEPLQAVERPSVACANGERDITIISIVSNSALRRMGSPQGIALRSRVRESCP